MKLTRPDAILAGHALLLCAMAAWRAIETTPGLRSGEGPGLEGTLAGELLLTASVLAAVAALCAVAVATVRERRADALVLASLLALSLAMRATFDAFDLAYLLAVPIAIVLRLAERDRAGSAAHAGGPGC